MSKGNRVYNTKKRVRNSPSTKSYFFTNFPSTTILHKSILEKSQLGRKALACSTALSKLVLKSW